MLLFQKTKDPLWWSVPEISLKMDAVKIIHFWPKRTTVQQVCSFQDFRVGSKIRKLNKLSSSSSLCSKHRPSKVKSMYKASKITMPNNLAMKLFSLLSRSFHCCPRDSKQYYQPAATEKGQQEGSLVMARGGVLHPPRNACRKGIKIVLWSYSLMERPM